MQELVAKRYVKALQKSMSAQELKETLEVLRGIAAAFEDQKIRTLLLSPQIKEEKKAELLLEALKPQNPKIVNLIKLLALKRRLSLIPYLVRELEREIALLEKRFEGCVYSDFELSREEIEKIEKALSKRVGATIVLSPCGTYDGIRVEVEIVGVEIDFSRSRIKKQLIENILKAI